VPCRYSRVQYVANEHSADIHTGRSPMRLRRCSAPALYSVRLIPIWGADRKEIGGGGGGTMEGKVTGEWEESENKE
jgi:hypothetical protein